MLNSDFDDRIRNQLAVAPAYHKVGPELIRKLKEALDKSECRAGQNLAQKDFGTILGVPKSTAHDWVEGAIPSQIKALLSGLERLSESQRTHLFGEFCRDCPRLDHPKLVHNPQAVRTLSHALQQHSGLTIVHASEDSACTFLFTAIGNSMRRISPEQSVCGIDVHFPVHFSPIPGIFYVRPNTSPQTTGDIVRQVWSRLRRCQHEILMLNGVTAVADELAADVFSMSKTRHVVLAGTSLPILGGGARMPAYQATIATASVDKRRPQQIDVSVSYMSFGG